MKKRCLICRREIEMENDLQKVKICQCGAKCWLEKFLDINLINQKAVKLLKLSKKQQVFWVYEKSVYTNKPQWFICAKLISQEGEQV